MDEYMGKLKKKGYLLYVEAIDFGMARYGKNLRKDGKTSHLVHCLRVGEILRNEAHVTDWEILAGAILHDLIEESVTKYEEIEQKFGKRVASIVVELTDDKRLPRLKRKKEMLARLRSLSRGTKLIKLADRLDNLRDPWLIESKIAEDYYQETQKILRILKGNCPKLEEAIRQEIELAQKGR